MKKLLLILLCAPLIGLGQGKAIIEEEYDINQVTCPNDTLTYLKYDMSLVNGVITEKYNNIQRKNRTHYTNGKKDGPSWEYYQNYSDFNTISLIMWKNGKRDGLSRMWYENAQLEYEGNYKMGERDGLHKYWYENGQLGHKSNYKDGKLISKKCWNKKGDEIECE